MSVERVKEFFRRYDIEDRVREYEVSSATVELAAQAIGCEPREIAKSITFMVEGKPVLIVASGDKKINNSKFKAQFATKAKMMTSEEVLEYVGHPVGGVCPFAINEGVTVYLDESLKRFEAVYPACGSSNSVIRLTIEELEKYSNYVGWVDVCTE